MFDVISCIITAITGLGIGIMSGMLGVGGGTMMVPVFRLGFGLDAIVATATSLFAIIFVSISGAATHIRNKTALVPVGIAAGIGGGLTSPVGVWLASLSPSWAIMLAAACVITYSSYNMIKKALAMPSKKKLAKMAAEAPKAGAAGEKSVPVVTLEPPEITKEVCLKAGCIGLVAGLFSGYVGVGGGFIMVPMFLALLNVPMRFASGSSLLAIIIIAIPGVVTQFTLGNVNVLVGLIISAGAIPGAVIGANFAKKIPERQLRIMFSVLLIASAVLLVANEVL